MAKRKVRNSVRAMALLVALFSFNTAQAASAKYCEAYARDYARNNSRQGQVLGNGVVGSLVGLGIGAAFGGAAIGAAVGGGLGAISGGARRQATAEGLYNAAYRDCMAGRVR